MYKLELLIHEQDNIDTLLSYEVGNPSTAIKNNEYEIAYNLKSKNEQISFRNILESPFIFELKVSEEELLLLARLLKKSRFIKTLEPLKEKVHLELLKTLLN